MSCHLIIHMVLHGSTKECILVEKTLWNGMHLSTESIHSFVLPCGMSICLSELYAIIGNCWVLIRHCEMINVNSGGNLNVVNGLILVIIEATVGCDQSSCQ